MKATVIDLGNYVKTDSREPWAIYFVYTPDGNFVVKGMSKAVHTYVHQRFPRSFYRYTFWHKGVSRGHWGSPMHLYFKPQKSGKRQRWVIGMAKDGKVYDFLTVRRMPHKWLPIFNEASLGKQGR